MEKVIDRFLARAQIEEGVTAAAPAAGALALLQSMNRRRRQRPLQPPRLARLAATGP